MRHKTYVLAKAILERKDILFGSAENLIKPQAMKEKEDAWEAVRTEMIEQGFTNFERKSWRDVRNHDWQYLRRSAVAKHEHNQKAGVEIIHYNEVDKVVFEIMGTDEAPLYDGLSNESNIGLNNFPNDQQFQQSELADSSYFSQSALNMSSPRASKVEDQRQMNSVLSQPIAAGPCQLSRDSAQSIGFSIETKHFLDSTEQCPKTKEVVSNTNLPSCSEIQSDLLQSIISSSSFINASDYNESSPTQPSVSQPMVSSQSVFGRKRPHSCSSASAKSTEDEVTEAKLRLLMMQIRREEILMQQETYKLAQEEAKLRQERAKAELLEMQLRTERAKSKGLTL